MNKLLTFGNTNLNVPKSDYEIQAMMAKDIYEVIEEFLNTKKSIQTKIAYQKTISLFMDNLGISTLGDLARYPIYEMSKLAMEYVNGFRKTDGINQNRVVNPRTLNAKAYALSSFFNFLVNIYNYQKNPLKVYIAEKTNKRTTTTALTKPELLDILRYIKDQYVCAPDGFKKLGKVRDYLLFAMLSLSLRRSELVNLKWSDIKDETKSATVFQKGGTYKYLPLPDHIYRLLSEYRDLKMKFGFDSEYIFSPIKNNTTNKFNKPINASYIFRLIQKICKKLGITKNITPHSFRTTFITLALENNQDYISICNSTGHNTIEMIKYYDNRDKLKNNAINEMNDFFS